MAIHPFIHTLKGVRTSNLPVTSQPDLSPEPHAAHMYPIPISSTGLFCAFPRRGRASRCFGWRGRAEWLGWSVLSVSCVPFHWGRFLPLPVVTLFQGASRKARNKIRTGIEALLNLQPSTPQRWWGFNRTLECLPQTDGSFKGGGGER